MKGIFKAKPLAAISFSAACAAVSIFAFAATALAATPEQKCGDAVANAGIKYYSSITKAANKCELLIAAGDLAPGSNCRPLVGPVDDPKADSSFTKALTKLGSSITKKCTGVTLSNVDIGEPCDGAADVGTLATCIAEEAHGVAAESMVEAVFGTTGDLSLSL